MQEFMEFEYSSKQEMSKQLSTLSDSDLLGGIYYGFDKNGDLQYLTETKIPKIILNLFLLDDKRYSLNTKDTIKMEEKEGKYIVKIYTKMGDMKIPENDAILDYLLE